MILYIYQSMVGHYGKPIVPLSWLTDYESYSTITLSQTCAQPSAWAYTISCIIYYKSSCIRVTKLKDLLCGLLLALLFFTPFRKSANRILYVRSYSSPPDRRTGTVTRWWIGEALQSDQCLIYLLFLSHNQTVYSMYTVQYLATYCVVHEQ